MYIIPSPYMRNRWKSMDTVSGGEQQRKKRFMNLMDRKISLDCYANDPSEDRNDKSLKIWSPVRNHEMSSVLVSMASVMAGGGATRVISA